MRLVSKILPDCIDPIRCIEWVIAVLTLIGSTYVFTPLYAMSVASNGTSALASVLSYPLTVFIFAGILLMASIFVMYGLVRNRPKIRSAGWFLIFLARWYQILATILVAGFLPITWIYPLTISLVVLVLWANARSEVDRYAHA